MAKCYVKAFICDEMNGCEIVNSCGLRDNEEQKARYYLDRAIVEMEEAE